MTGASRPAPRPLHPEALGTVDLRAGTSRVTIIPALGGKIAAMELGGRQWLWTNDVLRRTPPGPEVLADDDASYGETGDTGGYDECFPTVGACVLPTYVKRFGGVKLPDHGELWMQPAAFALETNDEGLHASTEWRGRRMPYRFTRVVNVQPSGGVVMRYAVANEGADPLPFLWCAHPLLPLTPQTRLILPEGARARVYSQHHIELTGLTHGAEARWPYFRTPKGEVDLSRPDAVGKRYACKIFLDLPTGSLGYAAVQEGEARLEVTFDVREVPTFGLWLNRRGWTPFRRGEPYLNLGFEPAIGAPDPLTDALGAWKGAHWLRAGETRTWTLRWFARTGFAGEPGDE